MSRYVARSGTKLRAYGKVGLLIDDAVFARSRVARELYGADELPDWWVCAVTLEEGRDELSELLATMDELHAEHPENRALIVLDRLLPRARSTPPFFWEDSDDSPSRSALLTEQEAQRGAQVAAAFRELVARAEKAHHNVHVVPLSSHPQSKQDVHTPRRWIPRYHQPLFQYRRDKDHARSGARRAGNGVEGHAFAPLLRFRPEAWAANHRGRGEETPEQASARYLIERIDPILTDLVTQLQDPGTGRILVTGAGMSQASSVEHPGMPENNWLLGKAALATLREHFRDEPLPEPYWLGRGALAHDEWKVSRDLIKNLVAMRADKYILEFAHTGFVKVEPGEFNQLFTDDPHDLEETFRRHLRATVLQHDEGIPQRHWLAARLPFDLRLTTNFDGFHQRAAAYEASVSTRDPTRVISVYGGAATESELAFSSAQFEAGVKKCEDALREHEVRSRRRIVAIVVGYAFCDTQLPRLLQDLVGEHGLLYWIAPEAHEMVQRLRANACEAAFPRGGREVCRALLQPSPEHPDGRIIPVPTRAVDFFYDLWEHYSHALASAALSVPLARHAATQRLTT